MHFEAGEGVECAEGLVHEKNWRIGGEGAGEACALALATGELAGISAAECGGVEADSGEELVGALDALGKRCGFGFKNDSDVALDGEVREETDLLDDVAD